MVEFLHELKALGAMAGLAFIRDRITVRIRMAGLAIGILVVGRHILKVLIGMAGHAGDFPMFAGELEVGIAIMIKLNIRECGGVVTKRASLVDFSLEMRISMAVAALLVL